MDGRVVVMRNTVMMDRIRGCGRVIATQMSDSQQVTTGRRSNSEYHPMPHLPLKPKWIHTFRVSHCTCSESNECRASLSVLFHVFPLESVVHETMFLISFAESG